MFKYQVDPMNIIVNDSFSRLFCAATHQEANG